MCDIYSFEIRAILFLNEPNEAKSKESFMSFIFNMHGLNCNIYITKFKYIFFKCYNLDIQSYN